MNQLIVEVRTIQEDRVTLTTCIVTPYEVMTLGIQSFKIDEFMTLDKYLQEILVSKEKIEYRRDKWKAYLLKLLEELTT